MDTDVRTDRHPAPSRVVLALSFALALGMGVNVGAALLATAVIFPVWSGSPALAVEHLRVVDEGRFFEVVTPVVLVLALVTLVASRRAAPAARRWLRIAAVLFIAFFAVTLAYFVPEQIALQGDAGARLGTAELGARLQRWVALNRVRQGLGLIAFGAALHALGLVYASSRRAHAADAADGTEHSGRPVAARTH